MKLAYFVGDQHAMSQWLIKWSDKLEKESGGRITVKRFPGSQMGPVQQHYDFARTGQADVAWFLHGATPGRFPLTELVQVPYLVGSAEIGTKVLNDPELRAKYLDAEHKGVKVLLLLTHQPGNVHTTKKPIRTVEDMQGPAHPLRLAHDPRFRRGARRHAGRRAADRAGRAAAEGHDRRRVHRLRRRRHRLQDGRHPQVFDRDVLLRVELRRGDERGFLDEAAARPAAAGDEIDDRASKRKWARHGTRSTFPARRRSWTAAARRSSCRAEENAKFRKIGAEVAEAKVKELEGKGLPARAVYTMMKSLAEKHAKTSKNFWN